MNERSAWLMFAFFSAVGIFDMMLTWAFLGSEKAKLLGFVEKNPLLQKAVGSLSLLLMASAINSILNFFLAICLGLMFRVLGVEWWMTATCYLIIASAARLFAVSSNIVNAIGAHRRKS